MILDSYRRASDAFSGIVERHDANVVFIPQAIPVVGAIVSVPVAIFAAVIAINKVAKAHFSDARNNEAQREKLLQDSRDWGIILANQVLNIATGGLLNCLWLLIPDCSLNENQPQDNEV